MTTMRIGRRPRLGVGAPDEGTMSLVEHLLELRRRLFISALALIVAMIAAFLLFPEIFHIVKAPYCKVPSVRKQDMGHACTLNALGILDPFKVRLNVSFYAALMFASPIWLYQLWAFITPGLRKHERRWSIAFVAGSILLFAAGAALAYYVMPTSLSALLDFSGHKNLTTIITVDSYMSYLQAMLLVFGVAFEFPLLVVMLTALGILSGRKLLSWWRGFVFGIVVFTAVAVPSPDPFSMLLLAVPLVFLFFVSVGICRLLDIRRDRRRRASDEAIAAELGISVEDLTVPFVDAQVD